MKSIDIQLLQWFQTDHASAFDNVILVLTNGLTWIPLYLIILYILSRICRSRQELLLAVVFGLLCVGIVAGMNNLVIKPGIGRLRPCADPLLAGIIRIVSDTCEHNYSFLSLIHI